MKLKHNREYLTISAYALGVLIVAMLCYHFIGSLGVFTRFISKVAGYAQPIIYGVVIAFLLNPILRTYDDRLLGRLLGGRVKPSVRRALALLLTYITAFVFLTAFFAIVLPELINSVVSVSTMVKDYAIALPDYVNNVIIAVNNYMIANADSNTVSVINEFFKMFEDSFNTAVDSMGVSSVTDSFGGLMWSLFQAGTTVINILTAIANGVVNIVLGFIISIYILMDREKLFAQFKKVGRAIFSNDLFQLVYSIFLDISRIFSGFVIGKVIDSIIIGVICLVFMTILRFPYAVLISVIIGVTNVIPYFGPFIGAIPGFFIIFIVSPLQSLGFLVFVFLLQQLDGNVIGPKILGDTVGLSPLWIIVSILLFSGLWGILGMFIGVPVFAIIYTMVRRLVEFLLRKKGQSTNTRDYASESNPLIK